MTSLGPIPEGSRVIPGHENYCASNDGKIFSRNYRKSGKTVELKQQTHPEGYKRVNIYAFKHKAAVHRLVAMAFLENPKLLPQVNHKDGNKSNNCISNLEWCDNSWNQKHAFLNGLHIYAAGEDHANSKLSENDVISIKDELRRVPPYKGQLKDIGAKYGVTNYCIFDIKKCKSWRHLK